MGRLVFSFFIKEAHTLEAGTTVNRAFIKLRESRPGVDRWIDLGMDRRDNGDRNLQQSQEEGWRGKVRHDSSGQK